MQKIIGITGGIGSGKTTAANFIKYLGFPVYNSDFFSKELVNNDKNLKTSIINLLGNEAYNESGYNTRYVSKLIFNDDKLRLKLNSIIHPAVNQHFMNWSKNQTCEIIFRESALLFELKLNLLCCKNILITADENIRIKRIMLRDSKNYQEIKNIIKLQMPEIEKIKLADYTINNNEDIDTLNYNVKKIMPKLYYN